MNPSHSWLKQVPTQEPEEAGRLTQLEEEAPTLPALHVSLIAQKNPKIQKMV